MKVPSHNLATLQTFTVPCRTQLGRHPVAAPMAPAQRLQVDNPRLQLLTPTRAGRSETWATKTKELRLLAEQTQQYGTDPTPEDAARLFDLIEDLSSRPSLDPWKQPELFCQRWDLLYTTQPQKRYSTLAIMSFNLLKSTARVETLRVQQDVRQADRGYDNLVYVRFPEKDFCAVLTMRGEFTEHPNHSMGVAFHGIALQPLDPEQDGPAFREAFAEQLKDTEQDRFELDLPAPFAAQLRGSSWIDTPHLSENLRISRGNMGGIFVLQPARARGTTAA